MIELSYDLVSKMLYLTMNQRTLENRLECVEETDRKDHLVIQEHLIENHTKSFALAEFPVNLYITMLKLNAL